MKIKIGHRQSNPRKSCSGVAAQPLAASTCQGPDLQALICPSLSPSSPQKASSSPHRSRCCSLWGRIRPRRREGLG